MQKYNEHEEVNDLNKSLKTKEERIGALNDRAKKLIHYIVLKDNEILFF